ncbi:MAG: peptidylprolyl isomerase [Marinilabiliales bacterium]|nr:MAG: peptidylprolyl isomerase [Marinilabiliales bacterium]
MKVENNKVVSVTYRLNENDENGPFREETKEDNPLVFLFGHGNLIPGFENNLKDLAVNDTFAFTLKPEEAYGEYNEENISDIPSQVFQQDGKMNTELVQVGRILSLQDGEGRVFNGMVKNITDEAVTMDFNHPMAGKTLHFSGKVVEIRDASEEELSHGHVHGPQGHQH